MKKILLAFLCALTVGCASLGMPGSISKQTSQFDGTNQITMEPAWIYGGSGAIKFGLYKNSKMPNDKVILTAVVNRITDFAKKGALEFKIDGEIISLDSIDSLSDHAVDPYSNGWTSRRYEVSKDFIEKLINAKKVYVKINLIKEYVEGEFSSDAPMTARPSFKNFIKEAWGNK